MGSAGPRRMFRGRTAPLTWRAFGLMIVPRPKRRPSYRVLNCLFRNGVYGGPHTVHAGVGGSQTAASPVLTPNLPGSHPGSEGRPLLTSASLIQTPGFSSVGTETPSFKFIFITQTCVFGCYQTNIIGQASAALFEIKCTVRLGKCDFEQNLRK